MTKATSESGVPNLLGLVFDRTERVTLSLAVRLLHEGKVDAGWWRKALLPERGQGGVVLSPGRKAFRRYVEGLPLGGDSQLDFEVVPASGDAAAVGVEAAPLEAAYIPLDLV